MAFGFDDPGSTFFDDVADLLRQAEEAALNAGDTAAARRRVAEMRRRLEQFTQDDLRKLYSNAYKNGGSLTIGKNALDKSYRIRRKVARNGNVALNDVDRWIQNVEKSAADRSNLKKIRKIRREQDKILNLPSSTAAQRKKAQQIIDLSNEKASELNKSLAKYGDLESGPTVAYRRRRKSAGQARGTVFQRQDARQHFRMIQATAERDIINDAYIKGRVAEGTEWFIVSDGPSCGWSSHRDPEKANGKTVHYKQIVPFAHPNCVRRFEGLPDGPRSKKTLERIQELTGMSGSTLESVAKGAVLATQVAGAVSAIGSNPLVRQTIRAILNDKEIALSENTQKILGRWVNNYERSELAVLSSQGQEATSLNLNRLRNGTIKDLEDKLLAKIDERDSVLIRLRKSEMRVLSLRSQAITKRELVDKIEDYADYVRHSTDVSASTLRAVGAASQDEAALRLLYGPNYVKRGMTSLSRGGELFSNARATGRAIDRALIGQGERAQVEAIRIAATVLDPLPWLRAVAKLDLGKLRLSVGLTAEGRRDLASKLFLQMRGQEFREAYNISYSRNALGQIMKKATIRPQDIYDALLPRITFLGGPYSATIGIEGGKIIPMAHLFPDQAYLRQLSFRLRLTSNSINDFVRIARYNDFGSPSFNSLMAKKLKELPEDMIFTVDAFRNSPITASARFLHDGLDSFAVKLRPDSEVVRATWKLWARPDKTSLTKIVLVPRRFGGSTIDLSDIDVFQTVLGLWRSKGSIVETARILAVDPRTLISEIDTAAARWIDSKLLPPIRRQYKVQRRRFEFLRDVIEEKRKGFSDYGLDAIGHTEIWDSGREILGGAMNSIGGRDLGRQLAEWGDEISSLKRFTEAAASNESKIVSILQKLDETINFGDISAVRKAKLIKDEFLASIGRKYRYYKWVVEEQIIPDAITVLQDFHSKVQGLLDARLGLRGSGNLGIDMREFVWAPESRWPQERFDRLVSMGEWERDIANPRQAVLNMPDRLKASTPQNIRKYLHDVLPGDAKYLDSFDPNLLTFPLEGSVAEVEGHLAGLADLVETFDYMEKQGFRHWPKSIALSDLNSGHNLGAMGYYWSPGETLYMDSSLWTTGRYHGRMQSMISRSIASDHFAPEAARRIYMPVHEYGHHITMTVLNTHQKMELFNRLLKEIDPELPTHFGFGDHWFNAPLDSFLTEFEDLSGKFDAEFMHLNTQGFFSAYSDREISAAVGSGYSSTNWQEFFAENFALAFGRSEPTAMGRVVLEYLREEGII